MPPAGVKNWNSKLLEAGENLLNDGSSDKPGRIGDAVFRLRPAAKLLTGTRHVDKRVRALLGWATAIDQLNTSDLGELRSLIECGNETLKLLEKLHRDSSAVRELLEKAWTTALKQLNSSDPKQLEALIKSGNETLKLLKELQRDSPPVRELLEKAWTSVLDQLNSSDPKELRALIKSANETLKLLKELQRDSPPVRELLEKAQHRLDVVSKSKENRQAHNP